MVNAIPINRLPFLQFFLHSSLSGPSLSSSTSISTSTMSGRAWLLCLPSQLVKIQDTFEIPCSLSQVLVCGMTWLGVFGWFEAFPFRFWVWLLTNPRILGFVFTCKRVKQMVSTKRKLRRKAAIAHWEAMGIWQINVPFQDLPGVSYVFLMSPYLWPPSCYIFFFKKYITCYITCCSSFTELLTKLIFDN